MTATTHPTAAAYVQATNDHDLAAFMACFAENAVVDDAGRELRGIAAIKAWSQHEIMDANVTLEVLEVTDHDGEVTLTTKVDGSFDRTGLPDPLVISQHMRFQADKIVELTCRLVRETPGK